VKIHNIYFWVMTPWDIVTYHHTLNFRTISGISRALDILTSAFYRQHKCSLVLRNV